MLERLQVQKPLYPLLCLGSSWMIFIGGMVVARSQIFWLYLLILTILPLFFSYSKIVLKVCFIFVPLSIAAALLSVPTAGWGKMFQIAGRFYCFGISSVATLGLPPINLMRSLNQRKIPRGITLAMLLTIKFIPYLIHEMQLISTAMKTRGVKTHWWNPHYLYRSFLIPLIMRITDISDMLAVSLLTREFNNQKRATIYKPVQWHLRDSIYLMLLLAVLSFFLISYFRLKG